MEPIPTKGTWGAPEVSSKNNPRIWQGRDGDNSNEGDMNPGFLPRIFLGSGKGGMEPI